MTIVSFDQELADAGMQKIAWAGRGMPLLKGIEERLARAGSLKGIRIGISLVLEPKTANLALALRNAGADVSVFGASADGAKADVVAALQAEGIKVFAATGGAERDLALARAMLQTAPQILLDDGGFVIRLAHSEFPDLVGKMIGAAEETTSGVRPLREMHKSGQLRLPVLSVNDCRLKHVFDNVYGTGQSCVMALLDTTNLQIAGRRVLIVGYGWVGRGVAQHCMALGAKVTVAELDPIKALQALHDGHQVASVADAAPRAEVVFAATGIAGVITPDHVRAMPQGAILCTAGGGDFELPMDHLRSQGVPRVVRDNVAEYQTGSCRTVLVVAEGHCINCAAGEGNPIEVMDLSLSLQASAAELLATEGRSMSVGIHALPATVEAALAARRITLAGGSIEPMTPALEQAMRNW